MRAWVQSKLDSHNKVAAYGSFTIFMCYFCTYTWKVAPFVVPYNGTDGLTTELKDALSIAQMLGYLLAKAPAMYLVPRINIAGRLPVVIVIIALPVIIQGVGFMSDSFWINVISITLAYIPQSFIYGTLMLYCEGRQTTEVLTAVFSCSFLFGGGAARFICVALLKVVSPRMLPAFTGLIFLPISLLFAVLMDYTPPPSQADIEARSERKSATPTEQKQFLGEFAGGIILLTIQYILLTTYRSFRDFFAPEILQSFMPPGESVPAVYFFLVDVPGATLAASTILWSMRFKDNRKALTALHCVMCFGGACIVVSTMLFAAGMIEGIAWMCGIGAGVYLAYTPYSCNLYDRLVAASGKSITCVWLMFMSDGLAYVGTITGLALKDTVLSKLSFMDFFVTASYGTGVLGVTCALLALAFFSCRLGSGPRSAYAGLEEGTGHQSSSSWTGSASSADPAFVKGHVKPTARVQDSDSTPLNQS